MKMTKPQAKKYAIIASLVLAVILTAYTLSAHYVAGFITSLNGELVWKTASRGTFTPWPNPPGNLGTTISVLPSDALIYSYLVNTFVLAISSVLLWVLVGLQLRKATHKRKVKSKRWASAEQKA